MTNEEWAAAAATMDFAFQPIVGARTGVCLGCEALLRGFEHLGCDHPWQVFDAAYEDRALYALDLVLRERALMKFMRIPGHSQMTLFFNLDGRLLRMPDYSPGNTVDLVQRLGVRPAALCFEFSERHDVDGDRMQEVLTAYRSQGFRIALDDYGSGYSGLQLLYFGEPNYLKIDRFFVKDLAADPRKRLFVRSIIETAHALGISVIAEGVETRRELDACTRMGADYLQGWRIQRPTLNPAKILASYASVSRADRQRQGGDPQMAARP